MRSKGLGALLSAVVLGLVIPAAALAATPAATTGAVSKVTFSTARLKGSVDPNKQATTYYFQFGTTIALGTNTAPVAAGNGGKAVRAAADLTGLAPVTKYYYRVVAHNNSGTALGKRRSFTTRKQPLGVSLAATPNPVPFKHSATNLSGTLTGTGNAGRKVVLQSSSWPYTLGFQNAANEQVTNATGGFSFPLLSVGDQHPVPRRDARAPGGRQPDRPLRRQALREEQGEQAPRAASPPGPLLRLDHAAAADQQVAFQKKHNGQWVTIGGVTRLRSGKFSKNVRIRRGGTFRVWTGSSAGQYASNVGKKIKIKTFR